MSMFDRMRELSEAETHVNKQTAFQERIVKQLLKYANVTLSVAAVKREAEELRSSNALDFSWFADHYPKFPVRLLAQKLKYTHTATLGNIYAKRAFTALPWYVEFVEQVDVYNIDLQRDRAGFVFNLPYATGAFLMVLHNQPVQENLIRDAEFRQDEPWPRTTFPMPRYGVVLVLEAFDSFMQTVGTEWAS